MIKARCFLDFEIGGHLYKEGEVYEFEVKAFDDDTPFPGLPPALLPLCRVHRHYRFVTKRDGQEDVFYDPQWTFLRYHVAKENLHTFECHFRILDNELEMSLNRIELSRRSRESFRKQLDAEWPIIQNTIHQRNLSEVIDDFYHGHGVPAKKKMKIEIELEYPSCDIYDAKDTSEFLRDNFQDYLNANLSDGDDRLKVTELSAMCEGVKYTYK